MVKLAGMVNLNSHIKYMERMNSKMKKVLAICLALVMVVVMSLTVSAAPGAFVSSPSGNPAPVLVEATPGSEDCTASLAVASYADRDTLPNEVRLQMEKAYNDIVNTSDLTALNSDLVALAASKNILTSNLAVSDLFDISHYGCDNHSGHGAFDIVLKAETLKNFVGLMHFYNGVWSLVEDAKVYLVGDEWHLSFSSENLTPFAIVVDTAGGYITSGSTVDSITDNTVVNGSNSIQTGDTVMISIFALIMAASALTLIIVWRKSRKKND